MVVRKVSNGIGEIVCNWAKCRQPLKKSAWVTTCSHTFCDSHRLDDFRKEAFNGCVVCPTCGSRLLDKCDIIQIDLNPPDAYKSMVLAGRPPNIIMDAALRAVSFWANQVGEMAAEQQGQLERAEEALKAVDESNSAAEQQHCAELKSCEDQIRVLELELVELRRQVQEYDAELEAKTRLEQQLQHELDPQLSKPQEQPNPHHELTSNVMNNTLNVVNDTSNVLNTPIITNNKTSPEFNFRPVFGNRKRLKK